MTTADTVTDKQNGRFAFGTRELVGIGVIAVVAAIAARFFDQAVPVFLAAAVAALVPRQHGWKVRGPIVAITGLLALFVGRMWPSVAALTEAAAPPSESGRVLSWIVGVPIAGAIAILFVPRQSHAALRATTLALMLGTLGITLRLLHVQMGRAYHFNEDIMWMPRFGIHYHVAVDGVSLWLVLLTAFITPIATYASFGSI
ncbi:MAG: hypothetical protein M3O46_12230, partial [Myxococcota bacterium]|nr:hypothetical protein [Myxococcota bacterium]